MTIEATNLGDVDATLHWHGLRLENRFDGVPEETQAPIAHGGTFTYRLQFPDPGFYWYHPHIREDFAQEMGLYAGIIVEPADPDYWPPVDRQLAITLDDVLIEDGQMAPFERSGPDLHGDGPLRQRDADQRRDRLPRRGQGRRGRPPAPGQHGQHADLQLRHQRRADEAGRRRQRPGRARGVHRRDPALAVGARDRRCPVRPAGRGHLENRTPDHTYDLGHFTVAGEAAGEAAAAFSELRVDPELSAERERIQADLEREPDKTLAFVSQMPILYGGEAEEASSYVCPMHPEVTASEQATLPEVRDEAGAAAESAPTSYACPMHPEVTDTEQSSCPKCGMKLVPADKVPGARRGVSTHEHERHTSSP